MKRLTILLCVLAGCGGSSQTDASSTHDVGNFGFGCAGGAACPLDQVCCTMPGPPVAFGCVAPSACPMANQILCDSTAACSGGTPVCCGVDVPNGTGTYPQCNPASVGTSCTTASACQTHLGQSCNDTTKVQLCHVKAECTDAVNNQCCTFTSSGASLTFCIDGPTAALGGATCHN